MKTDWYYNGAYIVVAILLYIFLDQHQVAYFEVIAGPIAHNLKAYDHIMHLWFVITLANVLCALYLPKLSTIWKEYVTTAANAVLISSGYFWLVMRLYYTSFDLRYVFIIFIPIIGIAGLMFLSRIPMVQIAKFHIIVLGAVLLPALQYALIASKP